MIFFFYDRWLSSLLLKTQLNAKLNIDYSYISLNNFLTFCICVALWIMNELIYKWINLLGFLLEIQK